jgi:hypothetical protein
MRFRGTLILLLLFVALGAYVYFAEYRGQEARATTGNFRKKVVHFEVKDVNELTLKHDDVTITGIRKGDKAWEITNPAGYEADPDEWERLAQSILDIQREDSAQVNATDLASFGLDKPAVEVTVKLNDGASTTLQFGSTESATDFELFDRCPE